ncbi:MAG: hypothetical protein WB767_09565 [Nocardioides sp.]
MTALIALLALFLLAWSLLSTLRSTLGDDRGHRRPPASHYEDPTFLSPADRL